MHSSKIALCLILVVTLVFVLSCSVIPQGVKEIFKSSTPTNTNTPTATATATATPLPPMSLSPCALLEHCSEVASVYDYLDGTLKEGEVNEVQIPFDKPLWLNQLWRAKDELLLDQTMADLVWYFTIDGQDYFREDWLELGIYEDPFDPTLIYPAYFWGVVMDGWKLGETHVIKIGYLFQDKAYDGWHNYEKGDSSEVTWLIRPVIPPTGTPTATATYTPTPRPTAVPYTNTPKPTALPACEASHIFDIDNTTGGWVTLKLKGPAKYTFDLNTGKTTLQVCPGNYSYEAWGCGGAYDSGSMDSNSAHEFYCQ